MATNSDNYEFFKSSVPQSVSAATPYTDKQYNFINDINNGVYSTNGGLTSVEWDLTSIYNSSKYSDSADLFMTVPIVMTAVCSNGATNLAATGIAGSNALCTLKSGYQNLLHQIEITANGKTIHDMQAFSNVYNNFKLLSSLSTTDLQSNAVSLGMSPMLDNEKSMRYFSTAAIAAQNGVGLTNNIAYPANSTLTVVAAQNATANNSFNSAIQSRSSRYVDTSTNGAAFNRIYGAGGIMDATALNAEFKPYFVINNDGGATASVMTWYDLAIIPLKYVVDGIDKIGLVKKMDIKVRCFFNCGSVQVTVTAPDTATVYRAVASNFGGSCPLTVNFLGNTSLPTNTTLVTAGVFVARSPTTLGSSTAITIPAQTHTMTAARMYYSQVSLDISRDNEYITQNRQKQVVYERILYNTDSNIVSGGNVSRLVNSGIKNPLAICIIPLLAKSASAISLSQFESPYDTCPATYSPISLTQLQVSLGGVNVLNTQLSYTFENFLEQVALAESHSSADLGLAVGVISQSWWESNRVYFIDLSRGKQADKASPRNVNVSFRNNSLVSIDVMYFTVYADKFVIDVETGIVNDKV